MLHDNEIIEQFRAAMREHGIDVTAEIVADGKFHRVHVDGDRRQSRNGWYVLHLDGKPSGAFGCNKRYGNDQKFTWSGKATKPLSPEERRQYRIRQARQRAEREAAEKQKREAAAHHARYLWNQARPCEGDDHPYLKRKGVKSHGLRVGVWEKLDHENGDVSVVSKQALLIPIRDVGKNIHSMQAIFVGKALGDRDKDYLSGGAKEGLFYSIGKPKTIDYGGGSRQVIMIGEGYATVATAHEATGHAGIVAFDASNLKPVATALRARFPDAVLLLLADNDQWTLKPVVNPGLTRAKEAAAAVGGLVAMPPFPAISDGNPTDFNDLMLLSGADAVRAIIDAALAPAEPSQDEDQAELDDMPEVVDDFTEVGITNNRNFKVLGYNRGTYFIFLHGQRQIKEMSVGAMTESGLLELAPLQWWEIHFPGERSKIDVKMAANAILRMAEAMGIYDPSRIRGRGAWIDDGRMVWHHGDYLSVDGKPMDVTAIKSRYVYELDASLMAPSDEPMTDEDGKKLLELAKQFRWSKPCSAPLLAGWIALAPVCGALSWRPHIWLTGGAGCGKSTVLDKFAHHLMRGLDLFVQGNSTEAGLRQTLGRDAIPVLFDETESNEDRDALRIQNVISMIRQSSSESDAQTLKGTAGGQAMSFHIRSMFCLSSIQVALKHQADVERLTVLALRPKREDPDAAATWVKLSDALYQLHRDAGLPARLFRRVMDLLPVTLINIQVFANAAAEKFKSQRDGDQYGALMAGAWSLISTELVTKDQARAMLDAYDWSEHRDNTESDEGQRAMTALMEAHVRIKGGIEVTVYELVCAAFGNPSEAVELNQETANALLQRYGMKVRGDRLLLSNNSNELRRLMTGTTFEADYRGVLLRVDGADRNDNKPSKFNGVQTKCISLPIGPIVTGDGNERPF